MPRGSKKKKPEEEVEDEELEETEEEEDTQKTSIQISTRVRDRLWKLKFRKTYDEFLQELCDLYVEQNEME
jgi:hypothetical protein